MQPRQQIQVGGILCLIAGLLLVQAIRAWRGEGRKGASFSGFLIALVFAGLGYRQLAGAFGWPQPNAGLALVHRLFTHIAVLTLLGLLVLVIQWLAAVLRAKSKPGHHASPEPRLEKLLQSDERILWSGQPDAFHFRDQALAQLVFSVIPLLAGGVAIVLCMIAIRHGESDLALSIPLMAGVGFLLIGGYAFLAPWRIRRTLARPWYVITDRRALIIRAPGWNGDDLLPRLNQTFYAFEIPQIRKRSIRRRSDRRVDLIFDHEQQGERWGPPRIVDVGFVALRDWQAAEECLQRLHGRKSSTLPRLSEPLEGYRIVPPPLFRAAYIFLLVLLLLPWLAIGGALIVAGLGAVVNPRGFSEMWIALPGGLFLTGIISVLAYQALWKQARRTVESFQCDGQKLRYQTRSEGCAEVPISAICAVTAQLARRKDKIRGWWIAFPDRPGIFLSRSTTNVVELVTLLQRRSSSLDSLNLAKSASERLWDS